MRSLRKCTLGETCETCTDICVLAPDASSVNESGFIQSEMDIYPNLAEDQITISFTPSGHTRTSAEACITVWDIMGGPVLIRNISIVSGLNTFQLNIKNLVPGTYGIEVKAGNQSGQAKFVKR